MKNGERMRWVFDFSLIYSKIGLFDSLTISETWKVVDAFTIKGVFFKKIYLMPNKIDGIVETDNDDSPFYLQGKNTLDNWKELIIEDDNEWFPFCQADDGFIWEEIELFFLWKDQNGFPWLLFDAPWHHC